MNIKSIIAYILRDIGNTIEVLLFDLADKIDGPFYNPEPMETEKSIESMIARINLKENHRCPSCDGEGALVTPDGYDVYTCPDCQGIGIDIKAI